MKRKAGTFLYSLAPVFLYYAAQIAAVLAVSVGMGMLQVFSKTAGMEDNALISFAEQEYIYICSVLAVVVFVIPGYFWYRSINRRDGNLRFYGKRISPIVIVTLFFTAICIQFGVDVILDVLYAVVPGLFEEYFEVMEQLGLNDPSVFSVLYVVIGAPIAEELVFRGLTFRILNRNFSFRTANVIQALLFGIFHMNLIQGAYAFIFGLVFGMIVHRYGTIKASIITHIFVNLSGQILGLVYKDIYTEAGGFLICAGILAFLMTRTSKS